MTAAEFSQYTLQALREDGELILYRGHLPGQEDEATVLLLGPFSTRPSRESAKRLEHEFSLREDLHPEWAVRPVALVENDGRPMLVLDDPGGEPLDRLIRGPMEMGQFLRLAVGLAGALRELQTHNLIHKDVKPANVLVDARTGRVRLMGFGIASRLRRERQSLELPEFIAGTLPYMAPEQTGRMNRSIDSRSDLYALGVTLYEMLTGSLPFAASDPMEWVHCHIARQPVPPLERLQNIPGSLSAIIMKLLAKTAEDRYQTARGVEHDLCGCLTSWEARRRIDAFPLGEHDTPDRLVIPEQLYGRAREIETLLASFDRVVKTGTPQLVLVSGYSGIGKSSVVNELHKVLVPPRGLFTSGKFDQYKRDIPYSTLAQAFESLIRPLLGKSEAELAAWRDALQEALGPNARLIVDLVPEVKLIIGEPPPIPELPPQDAQRRFQLVFRRFIGVFARPEHPLALFLDDLQWLDAATLDLVENLLTQPDVRHLMLVGAYRDNEVGASHPLVRKLDAIRRAGAAMDEIALAPLAPDDVARLLADALHSEPARAAPLAQLVHEKTGGNPFFAIQFLSALAEEELLVFDHGKGSWSWDLDRIHAKGYTSNVVELMVGKLGRLPVETKTALQQLACLGNSAEITLLAVVLGTSEAQVHAALGEGVLLELVERREARYRFAHDRVQEAAYSLIPEPMRPEMHLRIGRLLVARTPPEKRHEVIFEIVNQLNRGGALIRSQDEREELAELNLSAGKRAQQSTAYDSALTYLAAGRALLPEDCWERRGALTFMLEFQCAECEFLTGAFAAAEERLSMLSHRAGRPVDFAAVTRLREELYTALGRSDRAVEACLDYLRQFGVQWSAHPAKEEVQREYERIWRQIGSRSIEELVDSPLMADPEWRATMDVLTAVLPPALFTDENLLCLVICRMANLSLEHGNSDAACVAYVSLGMLLGPRFGNYRAGFSFGKLGLDLVDQRGLRRFESRVCVMFGGRVSPWTQPVRTGLGLVWRAFDAASRLGDLTYAGLTRNILIINLLFTGDPLGDVQREAEVGRDFARQFGFGHVIDYMTVNLGLIRTLRGLNPEFGSFNGTEFDEGQFERRLAKDPRLSTAARWYWICQLQARFFAGAYVQAAAAASNVRSLLSTPGSLEVAEYHVYAALVRAALCDTASVAERTQHQEALAAHHRQLQEWAESCPANFEGRAALIGAEIARIEGRTLDAEQLYEQAIRSARANGFVHNEAVANELAARFYAARGFETISNAYLRNTRYCYLRWGADGKVRQLDQSYPQLGDEPPVASATSTIGTPVEHLDLATVVKVSQAVSGTIVLEKLLDTLMRTALEHAGAERGLLILSRGAEQRIAAEATAGSDTVTVQLSDEPVTATVLPESVFHYVLRTRESVILDDAAAPENPFVADPYICQRQARSILCLALINKAQLVGVLYLENNLTPRVFAPARIAALKLLASQAAISLENAHLYSELQQKERELGRLLDVLPQQIFVLEDDLSLAYANQTLLDSHVSFDARTAEEAIPKLYHPDDIEQTWEAMRRSVSQGVPYEAETRIRGRSGEYRRFLVRMNPLKDETGRVVRWYGTETDIEERKRAEEALRESEEHYRALIEVSPQMVWMARADGSNIFWNQWWYDYTGLTRAESEGFAWVQAVHPEHRDRHVDLWRQALASGGEWSNEAPLRRADGQYRWHLGRGLPIRDVDGRIVRWMGIGIDIHDLREAEETLRRSEAWLSEAQRISHTGSWASDPETREVIHASPELLRILGFDPDDGIPPTEAMVARFHPEDRAKLAEDIVAAIRGRRSYALDRRLVLPDGTIRHLHTVSQPVFDAGGHPIELIGTAMDVTERKRAEERVRQDERELRTIVDFLPELLVVGGAEGGLVYANRAALEFTGRTLEETVGRPDVWSEIVHPDDLHTVQATIRGLADGIRGEVEFRLRRPDGQYRWILGRSAPLRDAEGRVIGWFSTGTDIDDRKRAEQRMRDENLALREEVDKASMFEEIVGTSPALRAVLTSVAQVAPTDSTVLITGETGTGKELVARAIHKRSQRASRAFVSVNCAAIPPTLIASELFGHEKGAFTGALQRHAGRFELADGGTIFLDEVGDLPPDAQLALLRVLQEREFERVGSSRPIKVDVRVIAATNRDLNAAIEGDAFRTDLFYRLNVFPIEVPPLRERPSDIPLLVAYFVERYARNVGKTIRHVDKRTLQLVQSYRWPGNVRELQNVIERAVIICESETLNVDPSWLARQTAPGRLRPFADELATRERQMIEAALAESNGRVAGPTGAAVRLGMPGSTLESKIRALGIRKHRFKSR